MSKFTRIVIGLLGAGAVLTAVIVGTGSWESTTWTDADGIVHQEGNFQFFGGLLDTSDIADTEAISLTLDTFDSPLAPSDLDAGIVITTITTTPTPMTITEPPSNPLVTIAVNVSGLDLNEAQNRAYEGQTVYFVRTAEEAEALVPDKYNVLVLFSGLRLPDRGPGEGLVNAQDLKDVPLDSNGFLVIYDPTQPAGTPNWVSDWSVATPFD